MNIKIGLRHCSLDENDFVTTARAQNIQFFDHPDIH